VNARPNSSPLVILGWHEQISIPQLGIESAFAKMDTGADGSSLHARDIIVIDKLDLVEFSAPTLRRQSSCKSWPGGGVRRVRAPLVAQRMVRSSNGEEEPRPVIRSRVRLGNLEFDVDFSLTSREGMRFPVLIGRNALAGRFLVNANSAHLL